MVVKKKPKGENAHSRDTSDAALRRRAETEAKANPLDAAEKLGKQSPQETEKILEELRVHQIELEMQNDELRKTQDELDASRMKYFDLYDMAPIGYLTVSDKGLIVEANLTFATMLGVARSALPKKPFTKFIFHEDQDIFYMHRKPLFEKGEPQVCEMRILRDGGILFWARLDATRVEDTEGNPICRVVVSDITERKKTEAASRNYLKIAGTMFIALDRAGKVTMANDKAAEILGMQIHEIVGKNWFDSFIPERMRAEVKDVFNKILAGNLEPVSSFENPVITHDGRERIIQWENTYHHDDAGNISGSLASGMDITDQQKAKDALILKDIVFKSSIAANSIADIHGVITDANPMFLALWGYGRPDEVVGRLISEFFTDKEELIKVIESLNKTGEWKGEFVAKKKDGSAFISHGFATKIMDAEGNLIGYQSANIDVTEQKTAERKICDLAKFPEENPNPVMRVSSEGILIYSNKAGEAIQGDCGCAPGKEVPPFWKGIIFDCYAKKDVRTMEAAQGGRVFQVTLTPVADGGYVNMYWGDITERKKTEKSLALNRELLRDTAEMAKIGGWEFFVETLTQTWTEETFRILEVDFDKGAPKVPEGVSFIAPEYSPMADKAIQRAMEFGEPYDQEWEVITAKGNRKWVRAVAKVNRENGKVKSVSGSFQDITDIKTAEESLRLKNQMLLSINDYSNAISFAPPDRLFKTIVTKLKEITGAGEVLINDYDAENRILVLRQSTLSEEENTRIRKILGGRLEGFKSPVSKDMHREIMSSTIGRVKSLHEASFEAISKSVGKTIEKLFGFGWFVGLSLKQNERLVGTILIAGKKGSVEPGDEELLAYASTTANVLARRSAEIALAQNEERFRSLIEKSSDAIIVISKDLKITYASPSFTSRFGTSHEEYMGATVTDFFLNNIHEDDIDELLGAFEKCLGKPGMEVRAEFRLRHTDGTLHNFVAIGMNHLETPSVEGLVINVRDITEQKKASEMLRNEEKKYRDIVETMNDFIFTLDLEGNVLEAGQSMNKIVGWSAEDLIAKPFSNYVHPDDLYTAESEFIRAIQGIGQPIEIRIVRPDKTSVWVRINALLIMRDDEPENLLCVLTDINERKEAEDALRESERKFRETVEHLDEGYYSCTIEGVLLDHNPAFNALLGFDKGADLRGGRLPDFWQKPEDRAAYLNELKTNGKISNFTINAKNADGQNMTILANAHIVLNEKGQPLRIDGTFTDFTERILAEKKIIESEQKFRQLAENIDIVFWLTDWKEKKLLYVNKAYEKFFGMTVESAYADRLGWKRSLHPDDSERVESEFRQHSAQGKLLETDYRIIVHGEVRWIHEHAIPLKDEKGQVIRYINVAEDITQRQRHESEIGNLNSFLLAIRNLNQAIVHIKDFDQLLDESCRILQEINGYLDVSIAFYDSTDGCIVSKAHSGEHKPEYWRHPNECGSELPPCAMKSMSQHSALLLEPDNEYCQDCAFCPHISRHQTIIVPMLDADDTPLGVITACLELGRTIHRDEVPLFEEIAGDIVYAFRKISAEDALLASEKQFHGLFNAMAQGVVFQDSNGTITSANPAAERILGLSIDQMQGRTSMDPRWKSLHEDASDFPGDTHPVMEALRTGKEVRNVIMGIFNPSKEAYSWISVNASPEFRPGEDKPFRVFTTFEDITDRRRLEDELKKHNEALRETTDAVSKELTEAHQNLMQQERLAVLGQMAASVSHELRNPLSVINNIAYYLKIKFPDVDEKTLKMLDLLEKEVDRSDRIIGNMLSFSRQRPTMADNINVNDLIRIYISASDAIPGNINVNQKLSDIPPMSADAGKLRQILDNLVSNACQSMPDGGTIVISTKINNAGMLELSVKDTGHGMSEEIQSRIFEPLFSTKTTGFGLGLAIVKTLVSDHGGEIKVKSKEGKGSEFTVLLPIKGRSS